MALALMREFSTIDTKALLQAAHVPVRCINSAGGYQFFTPTEIETNRKYADYNALFIESVGHYPMLEKPGEFNEKLRGLLRELASKQ
jgi:pimeloyl-ACP methyl ester carboxylesterase